MYNFRTLVVGVFCALFAHGFAHAGTVNFQITPVSGGTFPVFQYTYFLSGFNFVANEELDLLFPATQFGTLSDGVVTPGFDLLLFQPNNPPGAPGDFSSLALSNLGNVTGPWSVDVVYLGSGQPGPQSFIVNQFDANGNFVGTLQTGQTTASATTPEPGSFAFVGLVLAGSGIWGAVRRRIEARSRAD